MGMAGIGDENTSERVLLLVEDNPDDVLLTMHALRDIWDPARVVSVSDGAHALEYLLGDTDGPSLPARGLPSLVLLDQHLPKVDGFEVLRQGRRDKRTRNLPVVILSSSQDEKDLLAGYDLGANSYVCKPVAFERFSAAVRQVGEYWLTLNEPPPELRG